MADMAHIPVKLKKQGKQCQFCIRILNQNALGIQLLSQHIRPEALRNQCKLQIPVIAHIVVDHINRIIKQLKAFKKHLSL